MHFPVVFAFCLSIMLCGSITGSSAYRTKRTISTTEFFAEVKSSEKKFDSGNNDSEDCLINDVPHGFELLNSQAGGHFLQIEKKGVFITESAVKGMLTNTTDGSLLKAVSGIDGLHELNFYIGLNRNESRMNDICNFVPEYRGIEIMTICGFVTPFMILNDITRNMSKPCVMDVKIGRKLWSPFATAERIQQLKTLYNETRAMFGLLIHGIRMFDIKSGQSILLGPEYGRNLKADHIKDAFKIFLNADAQLSNGLITQILSQLRPIQKWARSQTAWHFYDSSLMLAYDAKDLENAILCENNRKSQMVNPSSYSDGNSVERKRMEDECESLESKKWVFVKMIDFAHIFPAKDASIDENYLFAINNLVKLFEELLTECNE